VRQDLFSSSTCRTQEANSPRPKGFMRYFPDADSQGFDVRD